jgi:transcriptional antiterminator RfaH
MTRWYVVHTLPQSEARALWHLESQGFRCFLPRFHKIRRHARKSELVLAPLFPRYLFSELDLSATAWRAINGTRGVISLLANGPDPIPVRQGVVEALLAQCDQGGAVPLSTIGLFTEGAKIRITSGPFTGQVGNVAEIPARDRVLVLLNFLGAPARIQLPSYAIEAA